MVARGVRFGIALSVLAGCYGPGAYLEERAIASCRLYADCEALDALGVDDEDECVALLDDEGFECIDFDADAARSCVEAVDALTCEAFDSGVGPAACDAVCSSALD